LTQGKNEERQEQMECLPTTLVLNSFESTGFSLMPVDGCVGLVKHLSVCKTCREKYQKLAKSA